MKGDTTECTQRPKPGGNPLNYKGVKGHHLVKRPMKKDTNPVENVYCQCFLASPVVSACFLTLCWQGKKDD